MEFSISRNIEGWILKPASGRFQGAAIAHVEGVTIKGVKFQGRTILGKVQALWGATILDDELYSDMPTLRGIGLRGRFAVGGEPLTMDYDGFMDTANRLCKTATRVTLIGDAIYAKGAL